MLTELSKYIRTLEPIPTEIMLDVLNSAIQTDDRPILENLVDDIEPVISRFLSEHELRRIIKNEIDIGELRSTLRYRKSFIDRARKILPSLLSIIDPRDDVEFRSVIIRIHDFCSDFPIMKESVHEKRAKKEALQQLDKLKATSRRLVDYISACRPHVDLDFEVMARAIGNSSITQSLYGIRDTFQLQEFLNILSLTVDLIEFRERIARSVIFVGDNKVKTYAVETLYSISIWLERPKFSTTPGSDFSIACSLMYEIASGERDAGLAGAINKFSRSDRRKNLDAEEQELRWENSAEAIRMYESDNFNGTKAQIKQLSEKLALMNEFLKSKQWTDDDILRIASVIRLYTEEIKALEHRYGPNILWAGQFSSVTIDEQIKEIELLKEQILRAEIEIGAARRRLALG